MSNPYQVELDTLKQKVAELENKIAEDNKPKVVPWEPKPGNFHIGIAHDGVMYRTSNSASVKAQAEIRKYLRLLAYRDEFAPDYDPDWGDAKVNKFYVVHDEKNPEWKATNNTYFKNPIAVYLPKDVALALVKKLNSGEVLL